MAGFFGPEFAPKLEFVKAGFDKIFGGVTLPLETRKALLLEYLVVNATGDLRAQTQVMRQFLDGVSWNWPWFDEWRDRFMVADRWPLMWGRYERSWRLLTSTIPNDYFRAFNFTDFHAVRKWVQINYNPDPKPKTKVALWAYMERSVTECDFRKFLLKVVGDNPPNEDMQDYLHADMRQCQIEILAHSLSMAVFAERDLADCLDARDRLGLQVQKKCLLPNPLDGCEICQGNADIGPIDIEVAFPSGHLAPPFFPGCRCSLSKHVVRGS